jgi:uncharacterized repeat protein (TIGR01451 family)
MALFLAASWAAEAQLASSVTLGASPSPSNLGQTVTLTAAVTSGATGKVTFYEGTTVLGTSTISGSQAILTTVSLPAGTGSLHAHYLGDSNYAASNSNVLTQTVSAEPSLGLKPAVTYPVNDTDHVIVADFNNDGKPDLLATGVLQYLLLGNGNGTFQPAQLLGLPPYAVVSAVADFNGDGRQDIAYVFTSTTGNGVYIALGNGDGTFATPTATILTSIPDWIAAGDFNGDGKVDIAIAGNNGVTILLGNGDGTFQAPAVTSLSNVSTIAVGDFNRDGIPDLALGSASTLNVTILLGNGDGTFGTPSTFPALVEPAELVVADFNGDGKLDLAATNNAASAVSVLVGNGDGTFKPPVNYALGQYPYSIAAGDINGDGTIDLIIPNYGSTIINVLLGNGDGTFQASISYTGVPNPFGIAVGDFNLDGKTDVVVTSTIGGQNYAGQVGILLGGAIPDLTLSVVQGYGFTQGQIGATYTITVTNVGQVSTSGAVGVVDMLPSGFTATAISGNGWTCVLATLTCTRSDSLAPGASYPNIVITLTIPSNATGSVTDTATVSGGNDQNLSNNTATNTTNIRLNPSVSLTSSPNPSTLGQAVVLTALLTPGATGKVTFFNGTTILGEAPVSGGQASLTTFLLPSGTLGLKAQYTGDSVYGPAYSAVHSQTITETAIDGLQPLKTFSTISNPSWVAVADFNKDGKLDLATANNDGSISILLGNGDGTFQAARNYSVSNPYSLNQIAVADFNADGNPDLAVGGTNGLFVLLGKGDGTFGMAVSYSSGYVPALAIADFNLDGIPDIAIGGNPASILLGNGDGTFKSPMPTGVNLGSTLLVGDFNGDGKPDLFGAPATFTALVLLGNGDGTFQSPITVPTPEYPDSFALGDFNGDGKLDIAMTYWVGVAVLPGNGDGTFGSLIQTSVSASVPGSFAIAGDFNGDGKLDVAYTGYAGGYFVLVFGKGDGTFSGSAQFDTSGTPGNIAVADFNSDGKPDFALPGPGPNVVDILLGGQFSGLSISSTHTGYFIAGETGATYQLTVTNPAYSAASSTVTVTDTLPPGFTATAISGSDWTCTLSSLTCTQSSGVSNGFSYPAITVTVNISGSLGAGTFTNQAAVTYGGITNPASDPTLVLLPSTVTLNTSPGGSALGQPVTLTATVTAGATGKVTFRAGMTLLGVATIASGQATLTTSLLPAGSTLLSAVYQGSPTYAASTSTLQPFQVTAAPASGFGTATPNPVGAPPAAIAIGDFNLDGIADLVTANSSGNVSILLGNGNGTFHAYATYPAATQASGVAVGDFNGDGKPDLAVTDQTNGGVDILLGNGTGSFQSPVFYATGNGPVAVAVGDFNGDGIADLAVANAGSVISVSVLLGVGDGTFQPALVTTISWTPNTLAVADVNGDGKADLVVSSSEGYTVALLGNGNGTFNSAFLGYGGAYATVGNLSGQGNPEIVESDSTSLTVIQYQSNSFETIASYTLPAAATGLSIADVNGDGKLDVIAMTGTSLLVLFGNGDGTLQSLISYPLSPSPATLVAANFAGDARTDLAFPVSSDNIDVALGVLTPVLEVSSTHIGDFNFNSTGVYTLTVTNEGPGVTSGTVTVADTLPAGLTASAISGAAPWSCALATLTCTRSDALGVGASYTPIMLTVSVASNAASPLVNTVMVSGGGAIAATGTDTTIVNGGPPYPALTSPANGSTGVSQTPTLTWAASTGATSYDVYLSTSSPPAFVTNVSGTSYTPATLSGGATYYWQIVAKNANGTNPSAIWSFTTLTPPFIAAAITNPTPGSTLPGSTATFQWSTGTNTGPGYWIRVGTTGPGSYDVFYGLYTATSATVAVLPTDGVTLYVRLYSLNLTTSAWVSNDYTYTASSGGFLPAVINSPAPGSTLTSSTVTFQWAVGAGSAFDYWIRVGTTGAGSFDVFYGEIAGTSVTVSGLPTNGATIYVRLYTFNLSTSNWVSADYTYTAASSTGPTFVAAAINSPVQGSTLTSASATFQWTTGTNAGPSYWIRVGTTGAGSYDVFYGEYAVTSLTVPGLPTNGATLYVRLYSFNLNTSAWVSNDYTYTEYNSSTYGPATMVSPENGTTLPGSTVTFQWNPGLNTANSYWIRIGSTGVGSYDVYYAEITGTSVTVSGLPTNGETLYVRLYSFVNSTGVWISNDYTYTAQ